jgi:hypothetical protein
MCDADHMATQRFASHAMAEKFNAQQLARKRSVITTLQHFHVEDRIFVQRSNMRFQRGSIPRPAAMWQYSFWNAISEPGGSTNHRVQRVTRRLRTKRGQNMATLFKLYSCLKHFVPVAIWPLQHGTNCAE